MTLSSMPCHTIPQILYSTVERFADASAHFAYLTKQDGVYAGISFSALLHEVELFATAMQDLGVKKGDRVGIVSENRLEWVVVDLACACIGAVDVPVFPTLSAQQMEYIFQHCAASVIVASNSFQLGKILNAKSSLSGLRHIIVMNDGAKGEYPFAQTMTELKERAAALTSEQDRSSHIREVSETIEPDDLLTLSYTSGTTGAPKGVMLTHGNVAANVAGCTEAYSVGSEDLFLSYLPLCHAYERTGGYYVPLSVGATVAFAESLEKVASNIGEVRPTLMTSVPRLFEKIQSKILSGIEKETPLKRKVFQKAEHIGKRWLNAKLEGRTSILLDVQWKVADALVFSKIRLRMGGRLRTFVSGGAALKRDVAEFFMMMGMTILEGYGLTEASPVLSLSRVDSLEIETVGKPLSNVEFLLAEDGEILVRGDNVMKGYWQDETATQETIRDGWLYTGDIGILTEKGNVKITDRKKNIFVSSGGKNIAPTPIEHLLCHSKFIEQCVLIGENRPYCSALIAPNWEQLEIYAQQNRIMFSTQEELSKHPQIHRMLHEEINHLQRNLAKYERIRAFAVLPRLLTAEDGELTPKMSIKRKVVEEKYRNIVENLYTSK